MIDPNNPEIAAGLRDLDKKEKLRLPFSGADAFILNSLLQLVQRHPHLSPQLRAFSSQLSGRLESYLCEDPRLKPLVEAGNDVRMDESALPEAVAAPGQAAALYAILIEDEEGLEYLATVQDSEDSEPMCMVTIDPNMLDRLQAMAETIALLTHQPTRLVRFFTREVLKEVTAVNMEPD